MKTKGSKPVPTKKPKKPTAEAPAQEMTLANGTTVVLPKAADAPAPSKPGRKRKPEPTVATDDVPAWVRNAEAGPPLANASEAAPAAEPTPVPPSRARRAAKAAKANPAPKETPAAEPSSLRAIGESWLEALRADGHTPATVSSYGNDLAIAYEHLGADTAAAAITEKQVAGFNQSKGVVKTRTGKAKAQPTILKTRRALRLALTWAKETKLITKAPYPAA